VSVFFYCHLYYVCMFLVYAYIKCHLLLPESVQFFMILILLLSVFVVTE